MMVMSDFTMLMPWLRAAVLPFRSGVKMTSTSG